MHSLQQAMHDQVIPHIDYECLHFHHIFNTSTCIHAYMCTSTHAWMNMCIYIYIYIYIYACMYDACMNTWGCIHAWACIYEYTCRCIHPGAIAHRFATKACSWWFLHLVKILRFLSKSVIYSSFLSESLIYSIFFTQTLLFAENLHWNQLMFITISNLRILFIKILNLSCRECHAIWTRQTPLSNLRS